MKKTIFLTLCLVMISSAFMEKENITACATAVVTVIDLPQEVKEQIPENYSVLKIAHGNLNRDQFDDLVVVLKKNGEEESSDVIEHPEKRPLLLFIAQPDSSYKLAAKNDNVVLCYDCGGMMGDPFTGIAIKNGYFSLEHYGGSGWRWTRIITFKYSTEKNDWFLHKDGGDSFHSGNPDNVETNVKTIKDFGVVPFSDFNVYDEE